jgi:tRNA-dihydrouridine synthase
MRKLKATWTLEKEEQFPTEDIRKELLRSLLEKEDAYWGFKRSPEEMQKHLDELFKKAPNEVPLRPDSDNTGNS